MLRTTRTRAGGAAAVVAVLAALALTVPVTADARTGIPNVQLAKVKGIIEQPEALVAPGSPPTPCTPGRYKCPLGTGAL